MLTLTWLQPVWNKGLVSAGVAIYAVEGDAAARALQRNLPPAYYRDGLSCSVALVIMDPGSLSLKLNGKADASLAAVDRQTQTGLGLLPLLYQPKPERVGVIGLGSGLTITALVGADNVQQVECAELEPAVVETQKFWAPYNGDVSHHPKVRVRNEDGRAFIFCSPKPFDVIISEPSNPWIAGIGNLYTLDYYRRARKRLTPGGVYVQWCNLYALGPRDLALVVRTFFEAFPYGDLWITGGDLQLVGSNEPLRADLSQLRKYFASDARLQMEMLDLGFQSPEEFLGQYVCSREFALQRLRAPDLNRDDLPLLEYSAPKSLYQPSSFGYNVSWVRKLQLGFAHPPAGIADSEEQRLRSLLGSPFTPAEVPDVPPAWQDYFRLLIQAEDRNPALPAMLALLKAHPGQEEVRLDFLGRCSEQLRYEDVLALSAEPFQTAFRQRWAQRTKANALFQLGRYPEAVGALRLSLQQHFHPDVCSQLSYSELQLGQFQAAEELARRCLMANPYDVRALVVLGQLELKSGRGDSARRLFTTGAQLCPTYPEAWQGLATTELEFQNPRAARHAIDMYLRFRPQDKEWQQRSTELRRAGF